MWFPGNQPLSYHVIYNFLECHCMHKWLNRTSSYLGLLLSSNMSWSPHIESICSEARQILGVFYRCFCPKHHQAALLIHGSTIWNICARCGPVGSASDKRWAQAWFNESGQKFGLTFGARRWGAGYNNLFDLPTLEEHRIHPNLGKLMHNLCCIIFISSYYHCMSDLRMAVLFSVSKATTTLRSIEPDVISVETRKVSRSPGLEIRGWRPTVTAVEGKIERVTGREWWREKKGWWPVASDQWLATSELSFIL